MLYEWAKKKKKKCPHSHREMYSVASVASPRLRGDVCSQFNQIKYLFCNF